MEAPKPLSSEQRREALTKELGEMNKQILNFKRQIADYEDGESANAGLVGSFKNYGVYQGGGGYAGFPVARNEDGFSKKEVAEAKRVFEVFSAGYVKHHQQNKEHWDSELKAAEKSKSRILEELVALGVAAPVENVATAQPEESATSDVAEKIDKPRPPLSKADRLKAHEAQANVLRESIKYEEKYPSPEAIVIPKDLKTLPDSDSYPRLLYIHSALDQAEAEAKWITGTDNVKEQQDKIKYLKLLAENSPERKMVDAANEKAGADKEQVSFSREQASFLYHLYDSTEFSRFESNFNSTLDKLSERNGVIKNADYDDSDMSTLRYKRDVLLYAEGALKSKSGELPKWLIEAKAEFERLFPNFGKNIEKESKK